MTPMGDIEANARYGDEASAHRAMNVKPHPPSLMVLWCPKCERTDRYSNLKDRHFSDGKLCDGKPIRVRYEPVRQGALQ